MMSELENRIRIRAYHIWQNDGCPEGRERQHWEQAAREVLASGKGETPAKAAKAVADKETKPAKAKKDGKVKTRKAA